MVERKVSMARRPSACSLTSSPSSSPNGRSRPAEISAGMPLRTWSRRRPPPLPPDSRTGPRHRAAATARSGPATPRARRPDRQSRATRRSPLTTCDAHLSSASRASRVRRKRAHAAPDCRVGRRRTDVRRPRVTDPRHRRPAADPGQLRDRARSTPRRLRARSDRRGPDHEVVADARTRCAADGTDHIVLRVRDRGRLMRDAVAAH
jgi:hypothetical protein